MPAPAPYSCPAPYTHFAPHPIPRVEGASVDTTSPGVAANARLWSDLAQTPLKGLKAPALHVSLVLSGPLGTDSD